MGASERSLKAGRDLHEVLSMVILLLLASSPADCLVLSLIRGLRRVHVEPGHGLGLREQGKAGRKPYPRSS